MAEIKLEYVNSFTDSRGKRRHVFRRKGHKRTSIKGRPGSQEFMDRYHELVAKTGGSPAEIGKGKAKAGTIDAVMLAFFRSDAFEKALAQETQNTWRPILERFAAHKTPAGRRYGDNRIATLREKPVRDFLAGKTANAQKNALTAIRGFIRYAVAQKFLSSDPTKEIEVLKVDGPKSMGHMTWLEPQVEQYRKRHRLGTVARLALELLLNIAARRLDAHLIGQQHIKRTEKGDKLVWRPNKTKRSTGKLLSIKIMPTLQAAIDAIPNKTRADGVLTFIVNEYGKAFASAAAFGNCFARWCRAADLKPVLCDDGKVRNFRAHGLRKAALRMLAHAGCTGVEMMAVSGHSSLDQLQEYLEEVEQERAADAAMSKLANSAGTVE
ncbi:hypothetical protein [uncultured Bradyrhizobium sp.]|uniref:tyrosine-type recombinase/integrase n=1 Tax=Bradyrhizobium sp. TaxID=376 RepID=UPI002630BB25|nr:hypothetical protein [uncultured Bradyrhizobium sp.]